MIGEQVEIKNIIINEIEVPHYIADDKSGVTWSITDDDLI